MTLFYLFFHFLSLISSLSYFLPLLIYSFFDFLPLFLFKPNLTNSHLANLAYWHFAYWRYIYWHFVFWHFVLTLLFSLPAFRSASAYFLFVVILLYKFSTTRQFAVFSLLFVLYSFASHEHFCLFLFFVFIFPYFFYPSS